MNTSYFGRDWKITVEPQDGGGGEWTVSRGAFGTAALRCEFDIETAAVKSWWSADVVVHNFSPSVQRVIRAGDVVTVSAGYLSPGADLIFRGNVFQPLWERSNQTDYTLTLHCLVQLVRADNGYVSTSIPENKTPAEQVRWVAAAAQPPIPIEEPLDDALVNGPPSQRATAWSGKADLFFASMASAHHIQFWSSWRGINLRSLAPTKSAPDVIYSPPLSATAANGSGANFVKYTLLGTPQQTEEGVRFRTLLDPAVQLGQLVQLDNSVLKKVALQPGQKLFVDPDGIYVVVGIRHIGDTRGDAWESEITAVTRPLAKLNAVMAR